MIADEEGADRSHNIKIIIFQINKNDFIWESIIQ